MAIRDPITSTARLRDYQAAAVGELRAAVAAHGSAVYVLPTGAGKTVVASEIARLGTARGNRTLLLVHRRELVRQAVDTLREAVPGIEIGVEAAGWGAMSWAPLQVGMVQSIHRREHTTEPNIVIVDEAHHARAKTWENVLARWPGAARIGLTATPERLDKKGLGQHFAHMVLGPSIQQLVAAGWLAPTRTFSTPTTLDLSGVKRDRHGEYRRSELDERITGKVVAQAADAYLAHAAGRKAIFFGINRRHSRDVCAQLRERGVRAEHVDGTDHAARRDRIMSDFKNGTLDVVGNCDLISEGFDAPACEVVMLGAPTRSVTRYLQACGRAMRPAPDKIAMILDLAGNAHNLGLPDDPREWSLADGEILAKRKAATSLRTCSACRHMFYGRTCPACGWERPERAAVREVTTTLREMRHTEHVRHRRQNVRRRAQESQRRNSLKQELALARRSGNPPRKLREIANRRGYQPGWVYHVLRAWGITEDHRAG